METVRAPLLELGLSARTLPGESECGDFFLVEPYDRGVLVAVVDGLGHGVEAAEAAKLAVQTLGTYAGETVISLMRRCHAALPGTRGVVMSLASFNSSEATMTWLGVGNVEGLLLRADPRVAPQREALLLRGGVVGGKLPGLRASVLPVSPGDTLIFNTDGVAYGFGDGLNLSDAPQDLANRIMEEHSKGTDDALVLVARYLGHTL